MVREQNHVFAAITQRWNLDWKNSEPKEKIAAKLAFVHGGAQVFVRRGNDANINWYGRPPADAIDASLFDDAQEFALNCDRQLADFVEKHRSA
jgi:hypothetical protein